MDWDRRYTENDTPWDKGAAHPALRDAAVWGALSGRVLVPGCGTGHDVRELARGGIEAVGLDVAPLAIGRARSHPAAGGESYIQGDLFDLPPELCGSFDGVFEHTCFCAIDPRRRGDYVSSVAAALKPCGLLLGIFFMNPDNDEDGPPHGCTRGELDALFGRDFTLRWERGVIATYPGREGRELLRLLQRR